MDLRSGMPSLQSGIVKNVLTYLVKGTEQRVILTKSVLCHVNKFRQTDSHLSEAGGQLFARINKEEIRVVLATGPYKEDRKSRFRLTMDSFRQKNDIKKQFDKGLHFVGEWHTHPEPHPIPSSIDLENIRDCFIKSKHQLRSFIMFIVGTDDTEKGYWLSQHNDAEFKQLQLLNHNMNLD